MPKINRDTGERTAIEEALRCNRLSQAKVKQHLARVHSCKAKNRRSCATLLHELDGVWRNDDEQQPADPCHVTDNDVKNLLPNAKIHATKRKKFKYDPSQAWNAKFFTDPIGSQPDLNRDGESRLLTESRTRKQRPWSKEEKIFISEWYKAQENFDSNTMDYAALAEALKRKAASKSKAGSLGPQGDERTETDCRLICEHELQSKSAYTKDQSMAILEAVQKGTVNLDWTKLAGAATGMSRSGWDCFVHYRKHLETKQTSDAPPGGDSIAQDKLLLEYMAANGPQCVPDAQTIFHMAQRFLPDSTTRKTVTRIHASLLNPNLTTDYWSEETEQKLLILMKMYSRGGGDQVPTTNQTGQPTPVTLAARHFPERSTQQITHKWERSLDPRLDKTPFTKEEDSRLMELVRGSTDPKNSIVRIASEHFTNRKSHQVYQRWRELATADDLLEKYGSTVLGSNQESHLSLGDFEIELAEKDRH